VLDLLAHDAPAILATRLDFRLSLNVSPEDLMSPRTVDVLRDLLDDSGVAPSKLSVEATGCGMLEIDVARRIQ
jgi:EAL domain-containing protein (putative c-di-GMP-specific phosphodiesterase class I)